MSSFIDEFINYDEIEKLNRAEQVILLKKFNADIFLHVFPQKKIALLAARAAIPWRVGTTNRLYHWYSCNKLIRLSRKNSPFHESQLNLKLLSFLIKDTSVPLEDVHLFYGLTKFPALNKEFSDLIDTSKFNLILHPKSKGSAREWGLANFAKLISILPEDRFKIFISGTNQDGALMKEFLKINTKAIDITGKMSLQQFIAFINHCDGLVAASTGPLHIAAALGKRAIGLFSARRPIHPGRWMPIGKNASALVNDENCVKCTKKEECDCIEKIEPERILKLLMHERV